MVGWNITVIVRDHNTNNPINNAQFYGSQLSNIQNTGPGSYKMSIIPSHPKPPAEPSAALTVCASGYQCLGPQTIDTPGDTYTFLLLYTSLPSTTITSAVDGNSVQVPNGGTSSSNSIKFTFTTTGGVAPYTYKCILDGVSSSCTSPAAFSNLLEGSHQFSIQTTDLNGYQSTAYFSWTVVPIPPTEVYGKLRTAILSRHFALNKDFRTNVLTVDSNLSTQYDSATLLSKDNTTQIVERWKIARRVDDNPLMYSGLLLTSLAVESYLGSAYALNVLKKALTALSTLYKVKPITVMGKTVDPIYEGYILRGDVVTRSDDRWEIQSGQKLYSQYFFVGKNPSQPGYDYIYFAPPSDPRYYWYVPDDDPRRGDYYAWAYDFRHNEVSMDELVGLVAGYTIVYQLVKDPAVQSLVKEQVNKLATYLNANGYILVRPTGGFSLRGASGLLPTLQYPFNRAFFRITGTTFVANINFENIMRNANVWKCMESDANWFGLATALAKDKVCFDAEQRDEFAAAYLAIQTNPKSSLFQTWMSIVAEISSATPGTGFPPYVALTALDDSDAVVKGAYKAWLNTRRGYNSKHNNDISGDSYNNGARSCFASAVALLLGGANMDEEKAFVQLLQQSYTILATKYKGDIPVVTNYEIDKDKTSPNYKKYVLDGNGNRIISQVSETAHNKPPVIDCAFTADPKACNPDTNPASRDTYVPSALDYMAGLSLAWLYAKRQADKGTPVTTPGFPTVPTNLDSILPKAVIPKEIWPYYGTNNIDFRIQDIQSTSQVDRTQDLDLFASTSPDKSPVPAPKVPSPNTQLPPQFDTVVTVPESKADVYTGITLKNCDVYDISEVTGSIWAGVALTGNNDADGWQNVDYDTKFPLHGGIDPHNAHPYCLLGKLVNYFFIGKAGRQGQFIYSTNSDAMPNPEGIPFYLRINDDTPGNGSGQFTCRVRVWRSQPDSGIS
jgi:hypothetical protein